MYRSHKHRRKLLRWQWRRNESTSLERVLMEECVRHHLKSVTHTSGTLPWSGEKRCGDTVQPTEVGQSARVFSLNRSSEPLPAFSVKSISHSPATRRPNA